MATFPEPNTLCPAQLTNAQCNKLIDRRALLPIRAPSRSDQSGDPVIQVPVIIKGAKRAYGRTLCLITPIGGTGQWWTVYDKLVFDYDEKGRPRKPANLHE